MTRQMNDLATQRTARNLNDRIPWKNGSGEEIPKYGCVRLDSFDPGTESFGVVKPDGAEGLYLASGPVPIANEKNGGSGMWNLPRAVLTNGSLSVGDEIGPVDGEWYMDSTGTGYRVLIPPNADDIAVVDRMGQGGTADLSHGIIVRRCDDACNTYVVRRVYRSLAVECDPPL